MLANTYSDKSEKFSLDWTGADVGIEKFSISRDLSLHKKEEILTKITSIIKALNTESIDLLIWLNGFSKKVI